MLVSDVVGKWAGPRIWENSPLPTSGIMQVSSFSHHSHWSSAGSSTRLHRENVAPFRAHADHLRCGEPLSCDARVHVETSSLGKWKRGYITVLPTMLTECLLGAWLSLLLPGAPSAV